MSMYHLMAKSPLLPVNLPRMLPNRQLLQLYQVQISQRKSVIWQTVTMLAQELAMALVRELVMVLDKVLATALVTALVKE